MWRCLKTILHRLPAAPLRGECDRKDDWEGKWEWMRNYQESRGKLEEVNKVNEEVKEGGEEEMTWLPINSLPTTVAWTFITLGLFSEKPQNLRAKVEGYFIRKWNGITALDSSSIDAKLQLSRQSRIFIALNRPYKVDVHCILWRHLTVINSLYNLYKSEFMSLRYLKLENTGGMLILTYVYIYICSICMFQWSPQSVMKIKISDSLKKKSIDLSK